MLPDYLSYSQLSTMRGCPRQWALRYPESWKRSPQGALVAGRSIHEAVEWAENEKCRDLRTLVDWWQSKFLAMLVDEIVSDVSDTANIEDAYRLFRWSGRKTKDHPRGEDGDVWLNELGPFMLARYLDLRDKDEADGLRLFDDHSVELKLEVKLPDDTPVMFVIDVLLYVDAEGRPVIRDYKTGQVGRSDPTQGAVYTWGVRQQFGWHPLFEMVYLRSKDDTTRQQTMDLDYLADEVPAMFAWHQRQVAGGEYPPNPSDSWRCVACDVASGCPVGQRLLATREEALA